MIRSKPYTRYSTSLQIKICSFPCALEIVLVGPCFCCWFIIPPAPPPTRTQRTDLVRLVSSTSTLGSTRSVSTLGPVLNLKLLTRVVYWCKNMQCSTCGQEANGGGSSKGVADGGPAICFDGICFYRIGCMQIAAAPVLGADLTSCAVQLPFPSVQFWLWVVHACVSQVAVATLQIADELNPFWTTSMRHACTVYPFLSLVRCTCSRLNQRKIGPNLHHVVEQLLGLQSLIRQLVYDQ